MDPPHVILYCVATTLMIIALMLMSGQPDLKRYMPSSGGGGSSGSSDDSTVSGALGMAMGIPQGGGFVLECHVHEPDDPGEKPWYCNDNQHPLPFDLTVKDVQVFELKGGGGGRPQDEHKVSECKVIISFGLTEDGDTDGGGEGGRGGEEGKDAKASAGEPPTVLVNEAMADAVGGLRDGREMSDSQQQPPIHAARTLPKQRRCSLDRECQDEL